MPRILLILSLGLNLALFGAAYARWQRPAPAVPATDASAATPSPATTSSAATANVPARTSATTEPTAAADSMEDMRGMLGRLRAAGVPPEALNVIARDLVSQVLAEDVRRETQEFVRYRWQAGRVGLLIPPERLEQRARDSQRLRRELLGELATPAAAQPSENPKLVGIPTEKREQIQAILAEQSAADREARRTGRTPPFGPERDAREAATFEKIRAVLTPEEFDRYMLYHSPEAKSLQSSLNGTEVNDEQYAAIYYALKSAPAASRGEPMSAVSREVDIIEVHAGADAALHYASIRDGSFKGGIAVLKSAGLSSSEILNRRRTYWSAFKTDATQGLEAHFARLQQAYDSVTAGLSAEARAAFDRSGPGQQFERSLRRP